jgi:hypothetical protein
VAVTDAAFPFQAQIVHVPLNGVFSPVILSEAKNPSILSAALFLSGKR